MKKLLLLLLCCIVAYGSYGQVAITVDETGKITQIVHTPGTKSSVKSPEKIDSDQSIIDSIQKNQAAIKALLDQKRIRNGIMGDAELFSAPEYNITSAISITDNKISQSTQNNKAILKKTRQKNIALVSFYNTMAKNIPAVNATWAELYSLEQQIWELRDLIYTAMLLDDKKHKTYLQELQHQIEVKFQLIADAAPQINTRDINTWIYKTSALSASKLIISPLGIVTENLPEMADTNKLKESIQTLHNKINNLSAYNYSTLIMEQKKYNLQMQLERLRSYTNQLEVSENNKKALSKNMIIGKYDVSDNAAYNHIRFHNAADELRLTNEQEQKYNIYKNDDKIAIYTYNIPPKGTVSYEIKSVGFIPVLQFTKYAQELLKGVRGNETTEYVKLNYVENVSNVVRISYNTILDSLSELQKSISIYTSYLPPAEKIEFADDIDKAYTTRLDKLEDLQNDSSYKHTYTLGLKVDGKEVIKPKSFNFITYKRSRIQFAAGVHFFSGNAPIVVTEGTGFKTVSYNTPRYSAGVKGYLFPQTFADVNKKTWGRTFIRSFHMALLVDAAKPLENQYLGIGFDLLPGLGINAGPHFYRYTAYQLYNNAVVGEKKTLKVRDGLQMSLTMDGGLAKDIFTTFLKLF